MLLLLGWNPGDEQEMFSLAEAAESFDLDRVVKSGARFNPDKAKWFNEQHLRSLTPETLSPVLQDTLASKGREVSPEKARGLLAMMLERVSFLHEIAETDWLFEAPSSFDAKLVRKKWKDQTAKYLQDVRAVFDALPKFEAEAIEAAFKRHLEENELGFGAVLLPLRIVLTGVGGGPSMFAFAAYLGKEETLARIDQGLERIAAQRAAD